MGGAFSWWEINGWVDGQMDGHNAAEQHQFTLIVDLANLK